MEKKRYFPGQDEIKILTYYLTFWEQFSTQTEKKAVIETAKNKLNEFNKNFEFSKKRI